jgi:hypothetical protein
VLTSSSPTSTFSALSALYSPSTDVVDIVACVLVIRMRICGSDGESSRGVLEYCLISSRAWPALGTETIVFVLARFSRESRSDPRLYSWDGKSGV